MSLALVRRHVALAGLVGLTLALILTPASHVLGVGGVTYTVVALVSNIAVALALSKVYSKLSGDPGARGPAVEAGLAQILAFLASSVAIYNLIP